MKGAPKASDSDAEWAAKQDPKVARLEAENLRLLKLLGLLQAHHAGVGEAPKWMPAKPARGRKAAVACLEFSDWHLDENVDPSQVGGLNAYSREIAEMRLRRWADKACEIADRFKHDWDGAVVFVDGDLVSGAIHDELRETNEDYLPGTLVYWAPRIAAAFRQVLDHFRRVHFPCVVGNHGRLTKLKQAKGRGRNSWDWLLCQMVKAYFKDDPRATWELAEGSYLFVPVAGRHAFMTHGDEVNGGGGWAGIWSPLGTIHRRAIELGAAHGIRPAYSVVGHWHTTVLAHQRGLVCNGSGKGWDEYAAGLRLMPEPAMQNFWVETPEHGTTMAASLFLEDRKREGW